MTLLMIHQTNVFVLAQLTLPTLLILRKTFVSQPVHLIILHMKKIELVYRDVLKLLYTDKIQQDDASKTVSMIWMSTLIIWLAFVWADVQSIRGQTQQLVSAFRSVLSSLWCMLQTGLRNAYQCVLRHFTVKTKLDHVLRNALPTHFHCKINTCVYVTVQWVILHTPRQHFAFRDVQNRIMVTHQQELASNNVHWFSYCLLTISQGNA